MAGRAAMAVPAVMLVTLVLPVATWLVRAVMPVLVGLAV